MINVQGRELFQACFQGPHSQEEEEAPHSPCSQQRMGGRGNLVSRDSDLGRGGSAAGGPRAFPLPSPGVASVTQDPSVPSCSFCLRLVNPTRPLPPNPRSPGGSTLHSSFSDLLSSVLVTDPCTPPCPVFTSCTRNTSSAPLAFLSNTKARHRKWCICPCTCLSVQTSEESCYI